MGGPGFGVRPVQDFRVPPSVISRAQEDHWDRAEYQTSAWWNDHFRRKVEAVEMAQGTCGLVSGKSIGSLTPEPGPHHVGLLQGDRGTGGQGAIYDLYRVDGITVRTGRNRGIGWPRPKEVAGCRELQLKPEIAAQVEFCVMLRALGGAC
jgi:hypothetical protein